MTCAPTYPLVQWGTENHVVLLRTNCVLSRFYLKIKIKNKERKNNPFVHSIHDSINYIINPYNSHNPENDEAIHQC